MGIEQRAIAPSENIPSEKLQTTQKAAICTDLHVKFKKSGGIASVSHNRDIREAEATSSPESTLSGLLPLGASELHASAPRSGPLHRPPK